MTKSVGIDLELSLTRCCEESGTFSDEVYCMGEGLELSHFDKC